MVRRSRKGWAGVVGWGLVLVGALAVSTPVEAQENDRVRVFLDCPGFCDQTHTRSEIEWVDWVRDREDSDVHVLVSTRRTGSGGTEYTMAFIGRNDFEGLGDEVVFATSGDATQDERRDEFVGALALGLGRYAVRTGTRTRLRIQHEVEGAGPGGPPGGPPPGQDPADDPTVPQNIRTSRSFRDSLGDRIRFEVDSLYLDNVHGTQGVAGTRRELRIATRLRGPWDARLELEK